jgi:hypothetical protein
MLKKVSRFFKNLKRKSIGSDITCAECKGNDSNNAVDCSICLEHIHKNKKTLACKHSFHVVCIDNWLKVNFNCPICRRNPNEPTPIIVPTTRVKRNGGNGGRSVLHDIVVVAGLIAGVFLAYSIYKILF